MEDCVFCKIARKEIPSSVVYEDEECLAFLDINPQAKKHILVIPRIHMEDALDCHERSPELYQKLLSAAMKVAKREGLHAGGFRVVTNIGENARQSVGHAHIHLLGGEILSPKMR